MSKDLILDGGEVLLSTHEVPADSVLESLDKLRIRQSDQLQIVLALNEQVFNKTTHSQATRDKRPW